MFKKELCNLCGVCLVKCPFNKYTKEEAIAERRALMEGKWAPILRDCAICHACNEICPQGANPYDLISKLQGELGEVRGPALFLFEEYAKMVDEKRPKVLAEPLPEPEESVLTTCVLGERNPEFFDSMLYENLPKLTGPAYYCCMALELIGNEEGERDRAQGLVDVIARYKPREVICFHDTCYHLLSARLPEYGIHAPFRPVHLFEYLLRTLQEHQDKIIPLNIKIAYQRPCTSRSTPWKEHFLDQLLNLIGCERVARRYDYKDALCCGRMFTLRGFEERGLEAATKNLDDSLEHGAQALVCLCNACILSYGKPCEERGFPLYHISELCQVALGEKQAL